MFVCLFPLCSNDFDLGLEPDISVADMYRWKVSAYAPCSSTCTTGKYTMESDQTIVDTSLCLVGAAYNKIYLDYLLYWMYLLFSVCLWCTRYLYQLRLVCSLWWSWSRRRLLWLSDQAWAHAWVLHWEAMSSKVLLYLLHLTERHTTHKRWAFYELTLVRQFSSGSSGIRITVCVLKYGINGVLCATWPCFTEFKKTKCL